MRFGGMTTSRATAYASGYAAEDAVCAVLLGRGWTIHARRLRTRAGEVDIVAEKSALLAIIEVKQRRTLAEAASALTPRQQSRLIGACDIILAEHPEWGRAGVRIDVVIVDANGRMRRIADAVRACGSSPAG